MLLSSDFGGVFLNNNEVYYLKRIFKAIPLMSDFEKGRLYGIAEEMERQRTAGSLQQTSTSSDQNNNKESGIIPSGSSVDS